MKTIKKLHKSNALKFTFPDAVHVFNKAEIREAKEDGTTDIYVQHKVYADQEALDEGASQVDFAGQVVTVSTKELESFLNLIESKIK
ncbi:hypothetical protein DN752_19680 [Echinicola strongylocentroti]|uniref:Uncharacterized protein n=1 Tax=Echinicola strongylocentroti TaxID=1795355 RepID=A0A2Z4IM32_9BACT|nr:hypothetical protein [Echinicola strongylocentroti]AWW32182.1 hypothetical protein DN752_19680 [Echinicola strongylocentroti]